ncbi:anti-sigma factor family protein [Streptomyces sp. NPDC002845]
MTSTTDTAGHPEVTELSDLTEGLLSPSRSSDVRRHLNACPLCADVYDSLEEIRGMLGTLPGPLPMPADVAGRIDAALAAEALLNATAPDPHDKGTPAAVGAARAVSDEDDDTHVSRETSSAVDRPAGHSRASTGPGRTNRKRYARRRTVFLGTVFTAAALGLGTLLVQSMNDNSGDGTPPAALFSGTKLEDQVTELLAGGKESVARSPYGSETDVGATGSTIEPQGTFVKSDVPPCVQDGIGRTETALAVEQGTYEGKNAYLVVLPDESDSTRVMAYVVDAACVSETSAPAGEVLLEQSYPKS